jgi:DNA-binding GntR family transcriptional regulator
VLITNWGHMNGSPARKLSTGASLADQAYAALRADITDGHFSPGQRVTERALASQLGVSPTPVREAIARLEHERLLERDRRALTVAAPSVDGLRELLRIEAVLRGVAARFASVHASESELAEIWRVHQRSRRVRKRGRPIDEVAGEVLALTREFHAKIDEAAHNPMLVDMIATAAAFDWALRFRAASTLGPLYPAREGLREHGEIVAALRARDEHEAERLMVAHTLRAGEELLSFADPDNPQTAPTSADNA